VAKSHKVQSVRAVVEQTIADLKLAKVMERNKIKTVSKFEKVLDCVIGLHNLRVLLKANPQFDIPVRRAAIHGEHIFRPQVPENEVDFKIPADAPDLSVKKVSPFEQVQGFPSFGCQSNGECARVAWKRVCFLSHGAKARRKLVQGRVCAAAESAGRATGHVDSEVPCGGLVQLRNAYRIFQNVA
jgi:hypothetical protein